MVSQIQDSYDPWDEVELEPQDQINAYKEKENKDPWDDLDFDEGFWTNAFRTATQVPQGIAEVTSYGLFTSLSQLLGHGEIYDPEEIERIKAISEREGIPFDEEAYLKAAENALSTFPTVGNIARMTEEATGLPLEPKTELQKGVRYASSIGKMAKSFPGGESLSIPGRAVVGSSVALGKAGLEHMGMNETAASFLAPLLLRQVPTQGILTKGANQPPIEPPYSRYETAESALKELQANETAFNEALKNRKTQNTKAQKMAESEALENWKEKIRQNKQKIAELNEESRNKYFKDIEEWKKQVLKAKESETILHPEDRIPFPRKEEKGTPLEKRSAKVLREKLGIEVPKGIEKPSLRNEVGNVFSEEKFINSTDAGRSIKNEVEAIDREVYKGVNDLYRTSKDLNKEITDVQINLAGQLENRIAAIEEIPDLSSVEKELLSSLKNIRKSLVEIDPTTHEISGYKVINNQTLIDQTQSLRKKIDYDFAHGDARNIFRPLIDDIESAAIETAKRVNPEAAQALIDAKAGYKAWAEYFDNPYIRPIRDLSNKDYSRTFLSTLNPDEFNMLDEVLKLSDNGQILANATKREIVEKYLGKFYENPKSISTPEFEKNLNELRAIISPEQSEEILNLFRKETPKKIEFKAKAVHKPTIKKGMEIPPKPELPKKIPLAEKPEKPFTRIKPASNAEKYVKKYLKQLPEDLLQSFNTRSGIKELREDLGKLKGGKEVYQKLVKENLERRLHDYKINKKMTGKELEAFFNEEKNFEIFSEAVGKEEAESLRMAANEAGRREVKKEIIKNASKYTLGLKAYKIIVSLL